jgi:hypothetical protein
MSSFSFVEEKRTKKSRRYSSTHIFSRPMPARMPRGLIFVVIPTPVLASPVQRGKHNFAPLRLHLIYIN